MNHSPFRSTSPGIMASSFMSGPELDLAGKHGRKNMIRKKWIDGEAVLSVETEDEFWKAVSTGFPAREKLFAFARKGDVAVVWKLDRLGRALRDLIDVVNSLQDRGVGLRSLQEAIDTTTPAGKLTFHIFAALAEFERDMIRERTRAGLAAAHKRGVAIGRPRALTPEQILMAEAMTADPAISTRQVAEQFGIHRSTLYRHLNARQKRSA